MTKSIAEEIAELSEEEQLEIYGEMTEDELRSFAYDWGIWGRPEQRPPEDGSWRIFLALAGRGWGKSRAGAEWIRSKVEEADKAGKPIEILLLGRTAADVRDVMVKAILECSPPDNRPEYSPSNRKLTWPKGSYALCTSSEKPDQLRGPSAHYGWADELAALKATKDDAGTTAWANLLFAVREGRNPQIFGTTTPKRTQLMKDLVKQSEDPARRIKMVKGSTYDNSSLSAAYLEDITSQYEGSDLAKQELFGEMLLEAEGLFFNEKMIEDHTIDPHQVPHLPLKFIAVDPSVAERPGDECGIVAVGVTGHRRIQDRTAYILEDYSMKGAAPEWIKRVVTACREHKTRFVVVEGNQGKQLLQMAITAEAEAQNLSLKVFLVHAMQGKYKRAEPVIVAMQQGRVKLVDLMPDLTDQMIFFDPENIKASPDRMDAMVWGVIAGLVAPPDGLKAYRSSITSPIDQKLPQGLGAGRASSKAPIQRSTRFGRSSGTRFR